MHLDERSIRGIRMGKEVVKLLVFVGDIIVYFEKNQRINNKTNSIK